MRISTTRFGTVECPADALVVFPAGLIGFPDAIRYVMLDHDRETPLKWLQSADDGSLAFVIINPGVIKPEYQVVIEPEEIAELGAYAESDLLVFVILTVPADDPRHVTANLRAPIVLNRRTQLAKQVILGDELPIRYVLSPRPSADPATQDSQPLDVAPHR